MNRITFALCASAVWAVFNVCSADWPLFHGDQARSGFSPEATTAGLVPVWEQDLGSPIYYSPVVAGGQVYITTADARLLAFDAASGSPIWTVTLGSWTESTPAISSDRLYIGCNDHRVYCLDVASGNTIWIAETASWVESSPLVFAGKVYIGGMDHHFYAFDALTGAQIFALSTGGDMLTSPSTDGQNVYFSGDDEQVHAITPSGDSIWTVAAGGAVYGAPLASEGKIVYASIANGEGLSFNRVVALDLASGAQIWQYESSEYDFFYGTPAVGYGNVYVGGFQGSVYAFDLDDGSQVWSNTLGDWAFLSSAALANGVLYVGCNDGTIYALDAFTGMVLDWANTGGFIQSSPAVAGGKLYVASADGFLRAYDLSSPVEVVVTSSVSSVPQGGTLPFDITFSELAGQPQSFNAWLRIARTSGMPRDYGGQFPFSLSPGEQLTISAQLGIPATVQLGDYSLSVSTGSNLTNAVWDASSFSFTITAAENQIASGPDWTFEFGDVSGSFTADFGPAAPAQFALNAPFPNPFNPVAHLSFSLPVASPVTLKVYDSAGRLVKTLLEGTYTAGVHELNWNASEQASGIYFFRLETAGKVLVQRGVLVK